LLESLDLDKRCSDGEHNPHYGCNGLATCDGVLAGLRTRVWSAFRLRVPVGDSLPPADADIV